MKSSKHTQTFFGPIQVDILPNDAQQSIIETALLFYLSDLEVLSFANAIRALKTTIAENPSLEDILFCQDNHVWEGGVEEVRKILSHPSPQNRKVGDYASAFGTIGGRTFTRRELDDLALGVVDDYVYFSPTGGSGIQRERQGLLGLTARDEPHAPRIQKIAVVNFINQLVNKEIHKYQDYLDGEQKMTTRSYIDLERSLSKESWLVCLAKNKKNKDTAVYVEGIQNNEMRFLNCYQVKANHSGDIFIAAQSLHHAAFNRDDNYHYQSFVISRKRGNDLKGLIRGEIIDGLKPVGMACRITQAKGCAQDADCDYALEWVTRKLNIIDVEINRDPFKKQGQSYCLVM